jgi:hypothetical protein
MSSRTLTQRPTRHTFEPSDAPGLSIQYWYHPEQPGMPMTRDGDGQEHEDAYVRTKAILADGNDVMPFLTRMGLDLDMLEEEILKHHE